MGDSLNRQFAEVGYYLSRRGVKDPPIELNADTWHAAYSSFYLILGRGKSENEFRNSLKNVRDHFDSHHNYSRRRGWRLEDGSPQPLSALLQDVFNDLEQLRDETLWGRIRPYLSQVGVKRAATKKAKFFSSEFMGTRASRRITVEKTTVKHGRVVENLRHYVENSMENALVYNTRQIDLALDVDGELRRMYEVKTATDTQSIYTAVGQLHMHAAGAPDVEKWIVLPGPLRSRDLVECLHTLGILVLWYRLQGKTHRFFPIIPS